MNGKSKIKIVLVFFLLITIQMFFKQFFYGQSSSVYVDLSKQTKKESVAGFLHLNDIDALNEQIKILKPKYWRLGNYLFSYKQRREIITGLTKREIIPIVVLSDLCIYKTINEESV
jgi:exonuclease I